MTWVRTLSVAVVLSSVKLAYAQAPTAATSAAAPTVEMCLESHSRGQELRLDARMIEAREAFRVCANTVCPGPVRNECTGWLAAAERDLPRLAIMATGPDGHSVDIRTWIDGIRVQVGTEPIEVDPGAHAIRVEADGFQVAETNVVVRLGEGRRMIPMSLQKIQEIHSVAVTPPVVPVVTPVRPFRVPTATWILGGVGLGVLAGGVGLGAAAFVQRNAATTSCAPFCSASLVEGLRGELVGADVLLGVGLTSLIIGGIVLIVDHQGPAPIVRGTPP